MPDALTVTVPPHLTQRLYQACRDEADRFVREAGALAYTASQEDPAEAAQLVELGMMDKPLATRLAEDIALLKRQWRGAMTLADRLVGGSLDYSWETWDRALAEATAAAAADLRARDAEGRARAERAAAAQAMTWQEMAEALWGPEYQTPLSIVAGVNIRTIQRAAAPGGTLSGGIVNWLDETMALVAPELRRAYGRALRGGRSVEGGVAAVERALLDLNSHRLP